MKLCPSGTGMEVGPEADRIEMCLRLQEVGQP